MSDETTPLTSTATSSNVGPDFVFPGGVRSRSRRNKMLQFQCCMGFTFLVIIIIALTIVLVLLDANIEGNGPILVLPVNQPLNSTASEATTMPLPDEPETEWALKGAIQNKNDESDNNAQRKAINAGIKALGDREILEESLQPMPSNSPAFRHYRSLSSDAESRKLARRGYVENHATKRFAELYNYTKPPERSNIGHGPQIRLPDVSENVTCDFNERYRRINGICNNKQNPRFYGAALIPYRRMVAPDYADGISFPRASHTNNTQLPSARDVSLKVHRAYYETDSNFTVMLAVFGQFLDHDITATSLTASQEGDSIDCCTVPPAEHPECFPVTIQPDDPFYKTYNVTCMNFVRSAPAPTGHFGPRQQLNQATAFIDGSMVYANTAPRVRHLRSMKNGTLRMFSTADGRELLPISTNSDDGCNREHMALEGKYCFESGDDRANENLLLTSMHLLWARHHNFLARGLQEVNPHWDDETLFQEARKILGAQMAHITYNEFLPVLLGRELADKKGLLPKSEQIDGKDTYDPNINPSIANCFAGAAFRFAHTLLPTLLNITRDNNTADAIELHKMLFNPFSLWQEEGIDEALFAAVNTPVQRVDRFLTLELTQKLFEGTAEDKIPICGLDLVSLNIQRGRDHGLPSYPVYRRHCQLSPVDTWEQLAQAVDANSLQSIRDIYNTPDDVDLYTGALSEPPLNDTIFGPLLTCLISDQFLRLKKGDSHWYERKIGPQRFTADQLHEIYQTTLAKIICQSSDAVQNVRAYVMENRRDAPNEYINCTEIVTFNFESWSSSKQPKQLHRARFSVANTFVRIMNPGPASANKSNTSSASQENRKNTKTFNNTKTNVKNQKD